MKIIFIILSLFLLTGCTPSEAPTLRRSEVGSSPQLKILNYQSQAYGYAYIVVDDPAKIKLLANHQAKQSSRDLQQQYDCQILVNANFYDTKDQPLGWLVSAGKTLSQPIDSRLFNGFLFLSTSKVEITNIRPDESVKLGLQSGPLLILGSKPLLLSINNDEPRRRIIAAVTQDNQLIFMAITGALLADVPELVTAISQEIGLVLTGALNLDGGSASAFITPEVTLEEYAYIGSFFCYTEDK